jgi:tetratricopeptide (TPR) repeat protein
MAPTPQFVRSLEAALLYWREQIAKQDEDNRAALDRERQNLYRVVRFGLRHPQTQSLAVDVALGLSTFVYARGYWVEWLPVLEEATMAATAEQQFDALRRLGQLRRYSRQMDAAVAAHQSALAVARRRRNGLARGEAHFELALDYLEMRRLDEAERHARASMALLAETGASSDEVLELTAETLHVLGNIARDRGNLVQATVCLEEALAIRRRIGPLRALVATIMDLATTLQQDRQADEALHYYKEAAVLLAPSDLDSLKFFAGYRIGTLHFSQQQWAEAEAAFRALDLRYLRQTGNVHYEAVVLTALGNTLLYQERLEEAAALLAQAIPMWQQVDDDIELANVLGSLGEVRAAQGATAEAATHFDEALALLAGHEDLASAQQLRTFFTEQREALPGDF